MPKTETIEQILTDIRGCRVCIDNPRTKPLPHEPRPVLRATKAARLAVFGQAPGTRVHKSGIPFTDPSGDRLRDWMGVDEHTFYDESQVAIIPMGFCFPGLDTKGGDLPPRKECAPHWRPRLLPHLVNVRLVLLVGASAQSWHLDPPAGRNLTETVANWREVLERPGSPVYVPLPHPSWRNNAWLKKNPWFEEELLPELKSRIRACLAA